MTEDKAVSCYARVDPRTRRWEKGCRTPSSIGIARLVMRMLGKQEKKEEDA
jgi:hypothetical protein